MQDSEARSSLVLIVEDIDWVRSAMTKSLERLGYRTAQATDDAEAFAVVEREPIDLILTEEQMPTFAVLMARLHADSALRKLPVVIINPDAEEGARHGEAYLVADYDDICGLLAGRVH